MTEFVHPLWNATADETPSTDAAACDKCRTSLNTYASVLKGVISHETCSQSQQWGTIVRAKVTMGGADPVTIDMIVWSNAVTGTQFAAMVDGCCEPGGVPPE